MRHGSTDGCVRDRAPDVELHTADVKMNLRLKTIPWARIIVDTLLVAALVLASSSFLSVR